MNAIRNICLFAAAILAASGLQAGIVAVNGAVTSATLSTAGTSGDPSVNLLNDSYALNWTNGHMIVGSNVEYVEIHVTDGADLTISSTDNKYLMLGDQLGGDNNRFILDGAGSTANIYRSRFGDDGNHNGAIVRNGAVLTTPSTAQLSLGAGASHNWVVVDDATWNATGYIYLGYAGLGTNQVTVQNGGKIDCASTLFLGRNACAGNLLTIEKALCKVAGFTPQPGNYVQINSGFFAWSGDHTAFDPNGLVMLWNGRNYELLDGTNNEALNWSATYYATDLEGQRYTGYDGLGGTTVFTGGPEIRPTTVVIVK